MSEIYSKDSFDRFGDDLMEVLLSYLSIDHKLSFECVSKQWQRLVYNKIIVFKCNYNNVLFNNNKHVLSCFESVVKKCPNISRISLGEINEDMNRVFDLVINYCNHLTKIGTDFEILSDNTIDKLFRKFGSNIKTISFYSKHCQNLSFLKSCPALTALDISRCDDLSIVYQSDQLLVKKLKEIDFVYGTEEDGHRFQRLIDCNKNSLHSIDVNIKKGLTQNQLRPLFRRLSDVSHLKTLTIDCNSYIDESFVDHFIEIGNKCQELKKFIFRFDTNIEEMIENIFNALKHFKTLKYLVFRPCLSQSALNTDINYYLKCQPLIECQNLRYFSFHSHKPSLVLKDFLVDIDKHLPKLQFIDITKVDLTEDTFDSLSRLKHIREIHLNSMFAEITEKDVMKVIENCRKIVSFYVDIEDITKRKGSICINLNAFQIYRLREYGLKESRVQVIQHY